MKRLHAVITGKVQAVGFREFVRHEATSRGLTGWVRNGDDGRTVEVVAEGDERVLDEFLRRLHEGPRFASVESVDFNYSDAGGGFARFTARCSAESAIQDEAVDLLAGVDLRDILRDDGEGVGERPSR